MVTFPCSNCKKECLSELFGTYSLVLIGPGTVVAVSVFPGLSALSSLVLIGLSFGATVGVIIISLGKHSGAHINPAVTIACSVSKRMPRSLLIPYVSFQVVGGLFAGLTLRLMFDSLAFSKNLGSTQLAPSVNPFAGIAFETVGTLALVLVILVSGRYVRSHRQQGFIIGATLFVLIILIGPLTGASFNPARSLGPSVASGYLANQMVYWIGPLSGGLIGAFLFNVIQGYASSKARGKEGSLCMC